MPAAVSRLDHEFYTPLKDRGRDDWFSRLRGNAACSVWPLLGEGADGARGARPRLQASVMTETRRVAFPRRAAGTLAAATADAIARGRQYLWLPLTLVANDDLHANAVWVNTHAKQVVLFEPHGSDAQHAGHEACGFQNFYVSEQYFDAFAALAGTALPDYEVVTPRDFQPAVFGQTCSDVRGPRQGDPWCGMWTCLFYAETLAGTSPRAFVADIEQRAARGELRALVVERLKHWRTWMH
jgi:hypothetical protein